MDAYQQHTFFHSGSEIGLDHKPSSLVRKVIAQSSPQLRPTSP